MHANTQAVRQACKTCANYAQILQQQIDAVAEKDLKKAMVSEIPDTLMCHPPLGYEEKIRDGFLKRFIAQLDRREPKDYFSMKGEVKTRPEVDPAFLGQMGTWFTIYGNRFQSNIVSNEREHWLLKAMARMMDYFYQCNMDEEEPNDFLQRSVAFQNYVSTLYVVFLGQYIEKYRIGLQVDLWSAGDVLKNGQAKTMATTIRHFDHVAIITKWTPVKIGADVVLKTNQYSTNSESDPLVEEGPLSPQMDPEMQMLQLAQSDVKWELDDKHLHLTAMGVEVSVKSSVMRKEEKNFLCEKWLGQAVASFKIPAILLGGYGSRTLLPYPWHLIGEHRGLLVLPRPAVEKGAVVLKVNHGNVTYELKWRPDKLLEDPQGQKMGFLKEVTNILPYVRDGRIPDTMRHNKVFEFYFQTPEVQGLDWIRQYYFYYVTETPLAYQILHSPGKKNSIKATDVPFLLQAKGIRHHSQVCGRPLVWPVCAIYTDPFGWWWGFNTKESMFFYHNWFTRGSITDLQTEGAISTQSELNDSLTWSFHSYAFGPPTNVDKDLEAKARIQLAPSVGLHSSHELVRLVGDTIEKLNNDMANNSAAIAQTLAAVTQNTQELQAMSEQMSPIKCTQGTRKRKRTNKKQ